MCKGTKTRVKLNEKGWTVGAGLLMNHKLPKEFYPLSHIENLCQDVMFVNVLMCVLRFEMAPGQLDAQYEIIAFKFRDATIVKRFQDIFEILTEAQSPLVSSFSARAPGSVGSLALVPSKAYHMGTLAPEKWGLSDRGGSTVGASEILYGSRNNINGGGRMYSPPVLPYGAMVPATAIQRRGYSNYSDRHMSTLSQGGMDDGNDVVSFGSSEPGGYREVAVMANMGNPGPSNTIPSLQCDGHKSIRVYDGIPRAEVGCQVQSSTSGLSRTNGWHESVSNRQYLTSDGSAMSDNSSIIFEDPNTAVVYANHSGGSSRIRGGSVDIVDGSASVRKVYSRAGERGRSVGDVLVTRNEQYYPQESTNMMSRSRSVDPLQNSRHPLQGSRYGLQTVSRQDLYSDSMSVRSQTSTYLLDPRFKRVYAKRNPAMTSQVYTAQPVYQQERFNRRT